MEKKNTIIHLPILSGTGLYMIVKKIKGTIVSFPSEKIMKEILDELNIQEDESTKES